MMKKLLILLILLSAVSCSKRPQQKETFLYVILSKHGEIQKSADGSFKLILDHEHVEKVVAFSNRPHRVVLHITAESFKMLWSKGTNNFAQDPPNASVIIDQKLQTIVVENISVKEGKTVFSIKADGSQSLYEAKGVTQLFIDQGNCGNCGTARYGTVFRITDPNRPGGCADC